MLLPSDHGQPASMMAQAFSIYKNMIGDQLGTRPTESSGSKAETEDTNSHLELDAKSSPTPNPEGDKRLSAPIFTLQSTENKN